MFIYNLNCFVLFYFIHLINLKKRKFDYSLSTYYKYMNCLMFSLFVVFFFTYYRQFRTLIDPLDHSDRLQFRCYST